VKLALPSACFASPVTDELLIVTREGTLHRFPVPV
jgi:hypothetical protein